MKISIFIIFIFILSGCSTKKTLTPIIKTKTTKPKYKPTTKNYITTALYNEYKKWYKTPYRYGGCKRDGVDCSSLVQQIYKDAFNIKIPRTTKGQIKIGHRVKKRVTKEGDLVFFKTGYKKLHVGIIIDRSNFIHTSTKYGVSISNLNNPYWKSRYFQTRRLLP